MGKDTFWRRTLMMGGIFVAISLSGCSTISNVFTGDGLGEIVDLHDGRFEITAAGSFSSDRNVTHAKWNRTAQQACSGGDYTVLSQEWQSADYPGILSGTIRCNS